MDLQKKDWTHFGVKITDIRKLPEFYIFTIDDSNIDSALIVRAKIFEDRLEPYFLKTIDKISRAEILGLNWNMYISKGYYLKIGKGETQKFDMDIDKYYVSYLEIEGPLGSFQTLYKEHAPIK
jgi:hypothetical protein